MNRRQRERETRILAAGEILMARFGRHGISFRTLAGTLRITTATLAWHYADLDALLGEILRSYLQTLHKMLGDVPAGGECRQSLLRAAYLKAIQGPFGELTRCHTLLTRDRHLLPEEELSSIEPVFQGLGELLAGDLGAPALDLLQHAWMEPALAEALLATIARFKASPAADPEVPRVEIEPVAPEPTEDVSAADADPALSTPAPASGGFHYFDLQDLPLPEPGSLAAMTDAELSALERRERRNGRGGGPGMPGQITEVGPPSPPDAETAPAGTAPCTITRPRPRS